MAIVFKRNLLCQTRADIIDESTCSHDDNVPAKSLFMWGWGTVFGLEGVFGRFLCGVGEIYLDSKEFLFHSEKPRLCEYSSLSSEMVDDSNHSHDVNVPGNSHVYVGLGIHIADLKRRLVPQ
ncbi:hypothetical protein SUGI_0359150 [Cryptomeria japonica]|nr:hypothetical protein SUGI_0359150 [Cryptomeria japonica]